MNGKKKRKKNRLLPMACALGIFIGNVCNSYMSVYAEALPGFPPGVDLVSAADCMIAYLTSAGVYISNQDWINEIYTSFGGQAGFYIGDLYEQGLLTLDEAGHFISSGLDTALESQSAWHNLHLDQLFSVSGQEAAVGGGIAATGGATIAGAIGGVATTGLLPLAVGVTGAYWGGIALGTLAAHAVGLYGKNIDVGVDINFPNIDQVFQNKYTGGITAVYQNGRDMYACNVQQGVNIIAWVDTGKLRTLAAVKRGSNVGEYKRVSSNVETLWIENTSGIIISGNSSALTLYNGAVVYSNQADFNTARNNLLNGSLTLNQRNRSPDIITSDGNAVTDVDENGNLVVPTFVPQINPNTESIKPGNVTETDYSRWARQAKANTNNNDPDANADIFEQILQAIKNLAPSPGANPSPDPSPTPVPKPDYDPSQPDQPEYDPKETEGPSDVTNGSPWTTPNILEKFPFCIPRDILRCFESLDPGSRQAPNISWHFTTPMGIHFDFDLDLNDYESVAAILRLLELIGFVVGLAIATRNLIGR